MSRELVKINTGVPVAFDAEAFKYKAPDQVRLAEIFKKLEFRQLQQAFPRHTDLSRKKYQAVLDVDMLSDLSARLESARLLAIDTETTSKNPMQAALVGLSFAVQADEAFYIPLAHAYPQVPRQLGMADVLNRLKGVLENPDIKKIGQNIKYDWIVLKRHGLNLAGVVFDTMLASYLINPSKRAHSLDQIALDFLDYRSMSYEDVTGKGKNAVSFAQVPLEQAVPYACEDADITLKAYKVLWPLLEESGLKELLEKVEMPLVPVLMEMEMSGSMRRQGKASAAFKIV